MSDSFSDFVKVSDDQFILNYYVDPCYEYQKAKTKTKSMEELRQLQNIVVDELKSNAFLKEKLQNPQIRSNFLDKKEIQHAEYLIAQCLNIDYRRAKENEPTKVDLNIKPI